MPINYKLNYWLLVLSELISLLGSSVFGFALSLYVLDLTHSAEAFSIVLTAAILPGALVSLFAGVFIDNHDKKKILVYSNILSGITVFVFMFLFGLFTGNLIIIIAYAILLSIIQSFFITAINTAIPNIVEAGDVTKANSALQSVSAIMRILGPVLGAIAYKGIGMESLFFLDGLSFIVSSLLLVFIKFSGKLENKPNKIDYLESIKELFVYLNNNRIIPFFLICTLFVNLIFSPLLLVVIPFVNYKIIGISGLQLSIIEASMAIGTILGAIIISSLKSTTSIIRSFFKILAIEALLVYLWIFPELINMSKWSITLIFGILMFLLDILNTMQTISILSYFQLKIPNELRGRLFGLLSTASMITMPLGILIYGKLIEKIHWTYLITGSSTLLLLLCFYLNSNKYFKEFIKNL